MSALKEKGIMTPWPQSTLELVVNILLSHNWGKKYIIHNIHILIHNHMLKNRQGFAGFSVVNNSSATTGDAKD